MDDRLWCCHEHEMIGNQQEGHGHQQAHGCEVVELDQEASDAVRAEWRKQATHWDLALAASLLSRDQAMHGFAAVDVQGGRIDPASISAASPSNHPREDENA